MAWPAGFVVNRGVRDRRAKSGTRNREVVMSKQNRKSSGKRGFSAGRSFGMESLEWRDLLSAAPAAAPTLWADDTQGRLFTVNVGTGATHVVGTMPAVMWDIAYDAKGNLYGVDGASGSSSLWKINPANASATRIGALGAQVNSLVFATNGTLYAAGSSLYKVSTTSGKGTKVGTGLSGYSSAGDLAFDASGNMFLSTSNNNLVKVNPSTGTATKVGALGFNEVYGMAYGPNHVLYGLSNTTDQIFSVNTSTGKGAVTASFANKGVSGVNGSTFVGEAIAAPSIEVDGNSIKIGDGSTATSSTNGTSFGAANVNSGSVTHTFTLKNGTASTLHLTSNPRITISGANASDFSVVVQPASSVAAKGSTTFQIKFTPHGSGTRSATITINNDNGSDPHYHFVVSGTGNAAAAAPKGQTIYAADSTGELFTVNSATGATHVIGKMPEVMYDIAFSKSGALYGIDNHDELWAINKSNGATSFIGSMGVSDNINSLTFGPDGYLYAAGSDLYKVNLSTGMFYTMGSLGGYQSAGDLAFDAYGYLVMTTTGNQLIAINPNTAQTALIGSVGYTEVLGMAEGSDGVLYGMSDASDQIFSINPITGMGSSAVHFSGVNGVNGAAVDPV